MTQTAQLGAVPNADYGIAVRQGLNLSDEALATMHAGASAPPTTFGGMLWLHTTTHAIKQRAEDNLSWLVVIIRSTTAPGIGDDSADDFVTGSIWADTTGKAVYICTDPAAGAAVWVQIVAGGGGGDAEITGTVDRLLSRTSGGGASTSIAWHAGSATPLMRGRAIAVSSAGAVATTWAPELGPAIGEILGATTSGNLTLAVPVKSGGGAIADVVPPSGYRGEWVLRIQNTSAAAIMISYSAFTIEGDSGPSRKIPAGGTALFWIATEDAGATWRIVGTPRREVAFTFFASGTPTANAVLLRQRILHPTLLPLDHLDISIPSVGTAPSADTTFTVRRESGSLTAPTVQDVMRVTFPSGNKFPNAWEMWNGSAWVAPAANLAVEYQRNDRLTVVCPAAMNGIADIAWAMIAAEREYQG